MLIFKFVSAAIDVNGDIYRWGANEYGQLGIGNTTEKYVPAKVIKSSDDLKFDLVAGGSNHQMAVDENGNVWIVGTVSLVTVHKLIRMYL